MKKLIVFALAVLVAAPAFAAAPTSRIKDIAQFEGIRENMLIGYGLVVGLAGTGDAANSVPFTRQTVVNMLERLGLNSKEAESQLKMKNVAAVMVTARMNSLARQGSQMDVTVSSLGDAKSLEGGVLVATPLMGADSNTYAVAQGSVIVGGFTAEGAAGTVSKNHTTVARIADGAIIERETGFELADLGNELRLILRNPDFTTAMRIKQAIDKAFGTEVSTAVDGGTVDIAIPDALAGRVVMAINKIENLMVKPDTNARVVIDEKTGTVVMGEDVRISDVAISHANLTIRISELQQVSQPGDIFAEDAPGETVVVDRTSIELDEDDGKFTILRTGASLADLVNGLNALGVKPRDIISILQNVKASGAIQAELMVL